MSIDTAGSVKRQRQIPSELEQLGGSVERLSQTVGELESRFSPALAQPEEVLKNDRESEVEITLAPVASEIRVQRRIVERITGNVRMIIERLEL